MIDETPYVAKPGPRDTRAVRARPSFEVATTATGAVHLAARGQAGHADVVTFCGLRLSDARITRDVDIWVPCDACRRERFTRQKWIRT